MRNLSRAMALLPAAALTLVLGTAPAAAEARPVPSSATAVAAGAPALPTALTGVSFLVADMDTGEILAAKDAHHPLLPASTLKVLTALTLIPRVPRLSTITPTFDDVNVEGSRAGIIEKRPYPAYQLFRAMLMVSGNDAANALATAAGGRTAVARLMNDEARRIGALSTNAVNPSGLDAPTQKTTAYDLAVIARAAMQLPDFRAYVSTKRTTINGKAGRPLPLASHNKVLWNYDGGIGIKNGYTRHAGGTFVGAATRGGRSVIVTVMKAQPRVWPEVASLLDWGFAAERAGATPLGRLPDPPGTRGAEPVRVTQVRAAVAHSRESSPLSPLVPLEIALGVGLVVFLVVRRRRPRRSALPL